MGWLAFKLDQPLKSHLSGVQPAPRPAPVGRKTSAAKLAARSWFRSWESAQMKFVWRFMWHSPILSLSNLSKPFRFDGNFPIWKSKHMSTSSSGILPLLPLKWCQKVNNDYSGSQHIATIISAEPEASLDWQPPASPATTMRPQSRAAQRSRKSLGSSKRSYRSGLIPRMRYSDFFLDMASMANLFLVFQQTFCRCSTIFHPPKNG